MSCTRIEAAWLLSTRGHHVNPNCSLYIVRPVARSRQGRVLLKCKTSTRATESVSYGIAIERSTSRASGRTSERASRQVPSRLRYLLYVIDVIRVWKKLPCKCINLLSLLSLIIILPLGTSLWLPSRDILFCPHLSPENVDKWTYAHHPSFPHTIRRLLPTRGRLSCTDTDTAVYTDV